LQIEVAASAFRGRDIERCFPAEVCLPAFTARRSFGLGEANGRQVVVNMPEPPLSKRADLKTPVKSANDFGEMRKLERALSQAKTLLLPHDATKGRT
jgi:hypothetical protein